MTTEKTKAEPETQYGFSEHHDAILNHCIKNFWACEFGCAKDGAANCYFFAMRKECKPSKDKLG